MAAKQLSDHTRTELAALAQRRGVTGWKTLKKDELVAALTAVKSAPASKPPAPKSPAAKSSVAKPVRKSPVIANSNKSHKVQVSPAPLQLKRAAPSQPSKSVVRKGRTTLTAKSRGKRNSTITPNAEAVLKRDLARATSAEKEGHDRFVVLVRDPHWLQAVWEFSRATIQRAEAALGTEWHRSTPILRVFDVSGHDATSRSEARLQDVPIHGGVNFWYVPIDGQPRTYRLQIGYLTPAGKFQVVARSNTVTPPRPGTPGTMSGGWDDLNGEYQRIFALSGGYSESSSQSPLRELLEEKLGRTMENWNGHSSAEDHESSQSLNPHGRLPLVFHAELILHGITSPDARVTVVDEPANVKPDGSFQVRLALEDGRHLIQTVVSRPDGSSQRTIILSVERNTKELEQHAWGAGE